MVNNIEEGLMKNIVFSTVFFLSYEIHKSSFWLHFVGQLQMLSKFEEVRLYQRILSCQELRWKKAFEKTLRKRKQNDDNNSPDRVAQWCTCQSHDLVVVSLIPG